MKTILSKKFLILIISFIFILTATFFFKRDFTTEKKLLRKRLAAPIKRKISPKRLRALHMPDDGISVEERIKNIKYGFIKDREIKNIIMNMSLEEKVGQLFMLGFHGKEITSVKERLEKIKPGGIIIFRRNFTSIEQMSELTKALQSNLTSPLIKLLIATDQEGGSVVNIYNKNYLPSNLTVGYEGDPDYAKEVGKNTGENLKKAGLNMDLAPVMDLYNSKGVVGSRSFGTDKNLVVTMGLNMIEGFMESNIIPVIKHFPGHGATTEDSHIKLPLIVKREEELEKTHFYPFQKIIEKVNNRNIAVMVGHLEYRYIDYGTEKPRPASLSKKIITEILREKMGFKGVVITDDLEMGGISNFYKIEDAAVEAINAGADIILICHTKSYQLKSYNAVLKAVKEKKITEKRIDTSIERILLLKKEYNLLNKKGHS